MTPEEKIQFVKNMILEKAQISPKGLYRIDLTDVTDIDANGGVPDDAPVILSQSDQRLIIQKLKEDGFLKEVWTIDENSFWIEKSNVEKLVTNEQNKTTYLDSGFDHNLIRNNETPINKQLSEIKELLKERKNEEKISAPTAEKIQEQHKNELKIIFEAYVDETRKILTIITPLGQEEVGFKKKKIKKEDRRYTFNQDALDKIENDKSETKFYKCFAAFFDMKKEVERFQDKENIAQGQSIETLANILKTNNASVRNYITRIRKFFLENKLPIKLETDNRGNYQMFIRITKKLYTKE